MIIPKPDPVKLARVVELQAKLKEAGKDLERQMLADLPCVEGETLVDSSTGLHYVAKGFSVSTDFNGRPTVHAQVYRVWKTGIKAGRVARSSSFVSFSNLERLPGALDKNAAVS